MPARLVLPRGFGLSSPAAADQPSVLDLEAKLRRAAAEVLDVPGGAEPDLLEALACQACEVLEEHESKNSSAAAVQEALRASMAPLLEGHEDKLDRLCDHLREAAEVLPQEPPLKLRAGEANDQEGYQRRGDKERERVAESMREQAAEAYRQREEEESRAREVADFKRWPTTKKEVAVPAGPQATSDSDEEEDEVTQAHRESTKRRLRELGQPVSYFAETDAQRWERLQHCELSRDQDVLADGSTNVMQILDRRQQREREAAGGIRGVDIIDAEDAEFAATEGTVSRRQAPEPESGSEEEEVSGPRLAALLGKEPDQRDKEAEEAQKKVDEASNVVTTWIRKMLRAWEEDLLSRAPEEERQQAFKSEKAQYRQSKQYLKPLRRALRDGEVDEGVIFSLAEIADQSAARRYRAAKEAYMRLAIGNHPWPMGVTFVTFHDRAARHKIGEGAQAHVLDDETTRKYVQMVKRLVTFAERKWPVDTTQAE